MDLILGILFWILVVVLAFVVVAGIACIIYARWHFGTLEGLGFPVVKPHWFLGSNPNGHNEKQFLVDLERSQQLGKVYGVYDGRVPTVFVSDPKLLRLILSQDFEHFQNHRSFLDADHQVMAEILDFLNGEKWKTIRSMLTPSLTSSKIKAMCEIILDVSDEHVKALLKENQGVKAIKLDFKEHLPPLLLEIIGKCFCGINIENSRDPDNKLIQMLKDAMGGFDFDFDFMFTLMTSLPFLAVFAPTFPKGALASFDQTIRGILKERESSGVVKQDMVNTLLEIFKKARADPKFKSLGITENTAVSQAYEFFVGSFEAVRTALVSLTYYLAMDTDIQDTLLNEIDQAVETTGGKVTADTISDLPYLTACITETLRIAPSMIRPDRKCTKDWEHNGIKIKKDMLVIIPLWALHRDPEQYPDPETFDPERFLPGRKEQIDPYAFNTFGQGPRSCIGQRFSYELLKIIMVQYLKEFRIERRADTKLKPRIGNPFFVFYEPIFLDFVKRR